MQFIEVYLALDRVYRLDALETKAHSEVLNVWSELANAFLIDPADIHDVDKADEPPNFLYCG
jgi:hypothetical protein